MRLVGYNSMGLLGRVGHKASESDLKKNELFLGGLNMDHNLSKITAAARCRPNKPPARRSIREKGHLGSFGKRSCMLLPVRFWMTPAPDGSKELSLHISYFNVRTFFFPLTFRRIWGAQSPILLQMPYRTVGIAYCLLIFIVTARRGIDSDAHSGKFRTASTPGTDPIRKVPY